MLTAVVLLYRNQGVTNHLMQDVVSVPARCGHCRTQKNCEAEVLALKEDARRSDQAWEAKIARKASILLLDRA